MLIGIFFEIHQSDSLALNSVSFSCPGRALKYSYKQFSLSESFPIPPFVFANKTRGCVTAFSGMRSGFIFLVAISSFSLSGALFRVVPLQTAPRITSPHFHVTPISSSCSNFGQSRRGICHLPPFFLFSPTSSQSF